MNLKLQAAELVRCIENLKDDDGRVCIDIRLDNNQLYNGLSVGDNLDLDGEIYDFIDTQSNVVPSRIPLRIRFHCDIPQDEQEKIRDMMQRHYTMKSYDVLWDAAANLRKMIGFSLFGVAVLAIYFIVSFTAENAMATEILSIIGSFSLWEAADALLLERPRLRREKANIMQNLNQTVEFIND